MDKDPDIIGYATPPIGQNAIPDEPADPFYYEAEYRGRQVRVLRFLDATKIGDIAGIYTITVWQDMALRASFVQDNVIRGFAVIATLVVSTAIIVWFGVRIGLRPLSD